MGTIVEFQKYHEKSKEAQAQRDFLKEHYRRFLLEFMEMPSNNLIQILRAYLDPLDYAYMIDWYFPDDIQRDMLRIDPSDEEADMQIKKGILRRYQQDMSCLEQVPVHQVIREIKWILDKLDR